MNDTEINIAIAEACDWHVSYDPPHYQGLHPKIHQPDDDPAELPSYTTDLNAMHEAVKNLSELKRATYLASLYNEVVGPESGLLEWILIESATAAQKAKAFVKAVEAWKD